MRAMTRREGERLRNTSNTTIFEGGVAVLEINGPVFPRADTMETSGAMSTEGIYHDLKVIRASQNVSSFILKFDTPGGATHYAGEVARFINEMAREKHGEAYAEGYMASLGYLWGSATRRITAAEFSELGSIGCVIGVPIPAGTTEHGDMVLIDVDGQPWAEVVSSISPLKRVNVATKEGHEYYLKKVNHHADTFVKLVAQFQNLDASRLPAQYGDGGCYPDTQALDMGLCAEVGSFETVLERMIARDWERGPSMTGSSGVTQPPPAPPAIPAPDDGTEGEPVLAPEANGGDEVGLRDLFKDDKGKGQAATGELDVAGVLAHLAERRPEVEGTVLSQVEGRIRTALAGEHKQFLSAQHQFAGLYMNALVDDTLFGGVVSYVNATGDEVQGTRAEMFEALLESLPTETLAGERVRSVTEGKVAGKVLKPTNPEATTVPEPGESGSDDYDSKTLLGMGQLGQAPDEGGNNNGARR